jgi:hypothetical protein
LPAQLHQCCLSVKVVENALVLAATRRLIRPSDAPPLGTIRSLAYFLPLIEEVLKLRAPRLLRISPIQARPRQLDAGDWPGTTRTVGADDGPPIISHLQVQCSI